MGTTNIDWAQRVWNPITGCEPVSPGCQNCYAERMAHRLRGRYGYPQDNPFQVTVHPDRMKEPESWPPSRIFVCSMGDLMHTSCDLYSDIFSVVEEMLETPKHRYLVLTKRPGRMKMMLNNGLDHLSLEKMDHIWWGVSAENQRYLEYRWGELHDSRCAHRFLSLEPLLGPVDLSQLECDNLEWVIVGGESGPGARPMNPTWVRSVRDFCHAHQIPFFFKQWGEWAPDGFHFAHRPNLATWSMFDPTIPSTSTVTMVRGGKKYTGCELDGNEHREYPTPLLSL